MADRDDKELSFLGHLEELRWRLIRAAIAVVVGAIAAFSAKNFIFDKVILAPKSPDFLTYKAFCWIGEYLGFGASFCLADYTLNIQNINMAGQFTTHIVVSLIAGFIVSFPYVFYQVWKFISPGLTEREIKLSRGIVFYTSFLFIFGVLFGYYLIAPLSIQFLATYSISSEVVNQITLASFISTITSVTLANGLVFQLPVVVYFLAKIGLVTPAFLKKYRKHALVVVLILSAIITPPDVWSQILVTIPLMLLYEISIIVAKRIKKTQ
ncbi:twin-arginine translocase subunit TatC [Luteibaculum oceani]|uniref:Sec-independent protein translocase protein TatC n=1 Tax=Luteibaculum oceani TaxID=1294296 RepID=A0A5C6V8P7_9FLAO|nr:twin-arginine translocase subunit TatC [Luteibaculum oceani]TXC81782.1 twin-arginine translocase subunit TatC [Luteibaculum oceani]